MTQYRDRLSEDYDNEIGSAVGCALDRLERNVTNQEINTAIDYYNQNKEALKKLPLPTRRDVIAEFISKGSSRI